MPDRIILCVFRLFYVVLVLIILGVSCSKSTVTVFESPVVTSPLTITHSSQANPTHILPSPSSAEFGVVAGTLIDKNLNKPAAGVIILLAEVIYSSEGKPIMAGIGDNSPKTTTDDKGRFVFKEVPSGIYGLAITTPLGSFLVQKESGKDFLFTVEGGKVLDLGPIYIVLPH